MKVDHVGIFTNHPRRMLDFYQNKLFLKKKYQIVLAAEICKNVFGIHEECYMAPFSCDDSCVEIFWPVKHKSKKVGTRNCGINHFGVVVANRKSFCEKLEDKFKVKVINVSRGDHRLYFIKDPDGNIIEVRD